MDQIFKSIQQWKFNRNSGFSVSEIQNVMNEQIVALYINNEFWLSFICSPSDIQALAIGFLWNEGIVSGLNDIEKIDVNPELSNIHVTLKIPVVKPNNWQRTTTGMILKSEDQKKQIKYSFVTSVNQIFYLFDKFFSYQKLHKSVGGNHAAALSDGNDINIFVEDIGRHNCLDKISGRYLQLGDLSFSSKILFLTGRISSEMIHKAQNLMVPMIISRTAVTINAIQIANDNNITLIGYLRENSFTAFTHPEQINN